MPHPRARQGNRPFKQSLLVFSNLSAILVSLSFVCLVAAQAQNNRPPVAIGETVTVHGYTRLSSLIENDSDPDGDPISLSVTSQAAHGTVYGTSLPNVVDYRPNAGYVGSDSFTYVVCDNHGACSSAIANLNVINSAPTPANASFTVHGYTRLELLDRFSDADGDTISGSVTSQASNGWVYGTTIHGVNDYRPNHGYVGPDSFTYRVCDSLELCTDATINLNVVNNAPVATGNTFVVRGYTQLELLKNAFDPDGDSMGLGIVVAYPSHGSILWQQHPRRLGLQAAR